MRALLLRRRQWWLAAMACAGVAGTHALSYGLVASGAHRGELLHATGHDLWPPYLVYLAVAAAVVGLAGSLTRPTRPARRMSVTGTALRLAALQGVAWVGVEVLERAVAGHGHLSARSLAPVLLGLGVQCLVALVGAAMLALLAVVADAVRPAGCRPAWRRMPTIGRAPQVIAASGIGLVWAWSPRGPPLSR